MAGDYLERGSSVFASTSGAFLALVGFGLVLVAVVASQATAVPDIHPLVPPTRPPALPSLGAAEALEAWLREVVRALVYSLCLVFYYLGAALVVAGIVLVGKGVVRS